MGRPPKMAQQLVHGALRHDGQSTPHPRMSVHSILGTDPTARRFIFSLPRTRMDLQQFAQTAGRQPRKGVPMDATNKIDYIEFKTTNVQASKTFFEKLLGWKFEDYGPDYTSFQDGRIAGG